MTPEQFAELTKRSAEISQQFLADSAALNQLFVHGGSVHEWAAGKLRELKPDDDGSADDDGSDNAEGQPGDGDGGGPAA